MKVLSTVIVFAALLFFSASPVIAAKECVTVDGLLKKAEEASVEAKSKPFFFHATSKPHKDRVGITQYVVWVLFARDSGGLVFFWNSTECGAKYIKFSAINFFPMMTREERLEWSTWKPSSRI